ncbi:MAG: hypothetical protein AB8H86_00925 [Polyangiales bacterium]
MNLNEMTREERQAMTREDWLNLAETVNLRELGDLFPSSLIGMWNREITSILQARVSSVAPTEILSAYRQGTYGDWDNRLIGTLEPGLQWGYRQSDEDAKELTRVLKRKSTVIAEVMLPVVKAARERFDFRAPHPSAWRPFNKTHKVRAKILALVLGGDLELEVDDRRIFSPFAADFTEQMAAIAPLPLVPLKTKEKVDYVSYRTDKPAKTKAIVPTYIERYFAEWVTNASLLDQGKPVSVGISHVLDYSNKPLICWGFAQASQSFWALSSGGFMFRLFPRSDASEDLTSMFKHLRAAPTPVETTDETPAKWLARSPEEIREVLLKDLPADVRAECRYSAKLILELYACGGSVVPSGEICLPPGLSREPGLYDTVEGGPYDQILYNEKKQFSECLVAGDASEDPAVHEIDHEGWVRGNTRPLSSFLLSYRVAQARHQRAQN